MKRAALVLLTLAGCRPIELGPERYPCDAKGNREVGSAQCPGASRCGLEGFCHGVGDTMVKWKCEGASDCEADWQCGVGLDGVSRECHDPNSPEDHRCLTSADCSGGWTCGLDAARLRRCHDPMKPKKWPCDTTADCAGGWQCGIASTGGLECHDPSRPEAFVCLSNADCLGGWQCGLNDLRTGRECHDPGAPRGFACEVASDCLASWSCGLNDSRTARECHDPSAPRAFACEVASDCLASWSCGLNDARTARECHDPANPRAFACQAPTDCLAGWLCGLAPNRLQRECHDPSNPQAFACDGDADCVGGWRCNLDDRCVDPSSDALLSSIPRDGGAAAISPADTQVIEQLSVSPFFRTRPGSDLLTAAVVRNQQLTALTRDEAGVVTPYDLPLSRPRAFIAAGPRWVESSTLRETPMVYAVMEDGGFTSFELRADGTVFERRPGVAIPPVTRFAQAVGDTTDAGNPTGSEVAYTLGFSARPTQYIALDGPNRLAVRSFGPALDRPNNVLHDLSSYYLLNGEECVFAVDSQGLWVEQVSWGGFQPVTGATYGNARCGLAGVRPERFVALPQQQAAVQARPWDGGTPTLAIWDLGPTLEFDGAFNCVPGTCTNPLAISVTLGPCRACPSGELLSWSTVLSATGAEFETRCGEPDGGAFAFYRLSRRPNVSGLCDSRQLVGTGSAFSQRSLLPPEVHSSGRAAFAGNGRLWFGADVDSLVSTTFDQAATGVARVGAGRDDLIAVGNRLVGDLKASVGFGSRVSTTAPTAVATNEPSWLMLGDKVQRAAAPLSSSKVLALSPRALSTPQTLVRATARDGTSYAVVAAGTELWTAEVDDSPTSLRPPSILGSRLATVSPMTSLVVTAGPDGGVAFSGYASTRAGVLRLTAETPSRWRAEDVPLPGSLVAKEVWFSGGRARVGFTTGVVFSLPSRVPVAPSLSEPVDDYLSACGRQLALNASGLFELEAVSTSPQGRWVSVALPPGFVTPDLAEGRLHAVGSDLYVFSRLGEVARVSLEPCVP